jgi:hypothetical protein
MQIIGYSSERLNLRGLGMRILALVCTVLLAISAPALAQNSPPPPETADGGLGGLSPGAIALGAAGIGLTVFVITVASKKSDSTPPTPLTCAQLNPTIAATTC